MLKRILPHISLVLGNMYIVFFLIDRVNTAMQFIDNNITKWLLLIFAIISAINSIYLIREERRRIAAEERRRIARERERAKQRAAYPARGNYR